MNPTKILLIVAACCLGLSAKAALGVAGSTSEQQNMPAAKSALTLDSLTRDNLTSQNLAQVSTDIQDNRDIDDSDSILETFKSQKDSPNAMSLRDLLKGVDSNLSLEANELLVKQASKDKTVAQLSFIPRVDVGYSFDQQNKGSLSYQTQAAQVTASVNLFNGFADINNVRAKNALLEKTVQDKKYLKESLYLQVIQQYYAYFTNFANETSLKQKLRQIREDIDRVSKLYAQGLQTIDDVESLKAQASLTEYDIQNAALSVEQSRLNIKYLTNKDMQGVYVEPIKDPTYKVEQRADIQSLFYQNQNLSFTNKQLNYYPTLDLSNTYTFNIQIPNYITQATLNNPIFGANFATNLNTLTLTLTYKLFDKIGLTMQKQSFMYSYLASEKQIAYKKLEQNKDVEFYRKSIEVARNQILSSKAGLESANISFENIKKKYDSNLITFADYLQALSTKYSAEATYVQSLNNYELQKANYIFYSGQNLEDYIK
ncbi:TolC family protein [Helicobacter sp. 11S02629-2]|uniref:TolC family protein n=1 Tax=Helicobacter sp. 11S02629-2 TaxID=1476195 RepID=UPI000BC7207E|nr:TolC family protein [Helicobacter sp. 11S02629-2]PAF42894.1 hypothetical protein BKH40_07460 [Helicobacter sp. 11S02629-2]